VALRIRSANLDFSKSLSIESIEPNRIFIDLKTPGEIHTTEKNKPLQGKATWLFGSPASFMDLQVEPYLKNIEEPFRKYRDYIFWNPRCSSSLKTDGIYSRTDQDGNFQFTLNQVLPKNEPLGGKMEVSLLISISSEFEKPNKEVKSFLCSPYPYYVGIKNVMKDLYFLPTGQTIPIPVIVVSEQGVPVANRLLSATFYRLSDDWWWDYDEYGRINENAFKEEIPIWKTQIVSTGQPETLFVKVQEEGVYYLAVTDGEHTSGLILSFGFPYFETDKPSKSNAFLSLTLPKTTYHVGEKVRIDLPKSAPCSYLTFLTRNDTILSYQYLNSSNGQLSYEFTATSEMIPNVYLEVWQIRHPNSSDTREPLRSYGIVPIHLEDKRKQLISVISAPDQFRPDQLFEVSVQENEGEPMTYAIMIVDEGLLQLTNFKTPNPYHYFHQKEAYQIRNWDLFDEVITERFTPVKHYLTISGGFLSRPHALGAVSSIKLEPLILHKGIYHLQAKQKHTHQFIIRNYIGKVRVMVIGANKDQCGAAEKQVVVCAPLFLLPTHPLRLLPGEQSHLILNLFSDLKTNTPTLVQVTTSGKSIQLPTSHFSVKLTPNQMTPLFVPIKATEKEGEETLTIWVSNGNHSYQHKVKILVTNPNPYLITTDVSLIQPQESVWLQLDEETHIEISKIPHISFSAMREKMLRYPHGCLEQKVSQGFVQLFADRILALTDQERNTVQNHLRNLLSELQQFQQVNGTFTLWKGESFVSPWADLYTAHFLAECQKQGYSKATNLLDKWINKRMYLSSIPEKNDAILACYELYVRSLAGKPEYKYMSLLFENRKQLPTLAKFFLALPYHVNGQMLPAKQIGQEIQNPASVLPSQYDYSTYGSRIRNLAIGVYTYVLLNLPNQRNQWYLQFRNALEKDYQWLSTQDISWLFLLFAHYHELMSGESSFAIRVEENGKTNEFALTKNPVVLRRKGNQKIQITNLSNSPITVTTYKITKVSPSLPSSKIPIPLSGSINASVQLYSLNGEALSHNTFHIGSLFELRVQVQNTGSVSLNALAISIPLPSGFFLENDTYLIDERRVNDQEYIDLRDDQILIYTTLQANQTKAYSFKVRATYPGTYYFPLIVIEDMYQPYHKTYLKPNDVKVVQSLSALP